MAPSHTADEIDQRPSTEPLNPEDYRGDFPVLETVLHGDKPLVFLDNAASTQHPRSVISCISEMYEKYYANVHRGIHWLSERSTDHYEAARETVRKFINAGSLSEVIFTSGTTGSINLVARSWGDANVGPGDEILLTEMEHHSNIVPWQQLAERTGCQVRFAPITDAGELDVEAFKAMLSEKTKLVAMATVSNVLGVINPVKELTAAAHQVGAKVLLDAAQSAPHDPTDVQDLNADFVAFSGHKMVGPSGVGILYGREALLEEMPPFLGGGSMIRQVTTEGYTTADLPAKFEAGTPPIVQAIGLGAAIDYLQNIGMERIAAHERLLTVRAHELIKDIPGLRFLGPAPEKKSGIVSFSLERPHPHDVAQLLDRDGVAIRAGHHCAKPLHKRLGMQSSSRASFYLYNTLEEVEIFSASLHRLVEFFTRTRKRSRRNSS